MDAVTDQKVKACFIETASGVYTGLESTVNNSFLKQILKTKNPFYHTGYPAGNFEAALQNLPGNRFTL